MTTSNRFWLMKSEPDVFSFDDLIKSPLNTAQWDGVRNYQARNFMRDDMKVGDLVFFYHSSCEEPGIQGIAEVVREAYPDHTASDPSSAYYDPKAIGNDGSARWLMVDVRAKARFKQPVTLNMIREIPDLAQMMVIKKGSRLSIQPVTKSEWEVVLKYGQPQSII